MKIHTQDRAAPVPLDHIRVEHEDAEIDIYVPTAPEKPGNLAVIVRTPGNRTEGAEVTIVEVADALYRLVRRTQK